MKEYDAVRLRIENNEYPFLRRNELEKKHNEAKELFNEDFEHYIVIGVGGSSQGSKAINAFFNDQRITYFDHLNLNKINQTLDSVNLNKTCFLFISKSGSTSEVLTIYDYLIERLNDLIEVNKNFITITEIQESPLHNLSSHNGIRVIEHDKRIGGRFSIFTHTGMIPISFFENTASDVLDGLEESVTNFMNNSYDNDSSPIIKAETKFKLFNTGLKTDVILIYGDELIEIGNWMKQLYGESLGKDSFGYMPIISTMTQDQHSLLQLYFDGPKDKYFEMLSIQNSKTDFINITLNNHRDAMFKALKSKNLDVVNAKEFKTSSHQTSLKELGIFFSDCMLETLLLAEIAKINPFVQDSIDIHKQFLQS